MAALTLFQSREANAFHELVMEVRTWWAVQLFPRLREEYEVRKQLAEREGRRVQTPEDVALLFSNSTLYAWFCWLERHVQKSKYSSSRWGLVAQIAREPQTAAERLKPGAPLELDPKLRVPDYYAAHDIHQHPGNLHGDANAGLVYEASALSIHPRTKRNELHERFIELVRREGQFQKVIDMGCGFGKSTIPLAHAFPRAQVTGVDVSEPCLKLAAADAKFSNLSNIDFRQADARHTGLKGEAFDLVTSTMLLHELPEESVDATLAETRRLLAPGGVSIHLDFRTEDPFWQFVMYGHAQRNNEPFLEPLIRMDLAAAYRKAGFDEVRIEPFAEREGATDPSNPFWRFPWAAIIARKPA
jgi:ubiquinone/menaquinone biosynthesis C-methylase UbiE